MAWPLVEARVPGDGEACSYLSRGKGDKEVPSYLWTREAEGVSRAVSAPDCVYGT